MHTLPTYPIFDGHNDTLTHIYLPERGQGRSFFIQSDIGHLDLPRAQAAHFGGGFFAIFVWPDTKDDCCDMGISREAYAKLLADPIDFAYAQQFTMAVTALLYKLEAKANGQIKVVRTATELETCLQNGILAIILHFEGAEAIDPDLDALYVYYEAGLRSLGPVWSRPNIFGHGVPFKFPHSPDTGPGLTPAGYKLIEACNQLGIMIDLAHINEKGFWDVAKLSQAPLVATHTAAHALCPAARNLTDKQLDAIGESGGIVGLTFYVGDLRTDGEMNPKTPLSQLIRHIDYIVARIGIDHVAFGSDFDGAVIPNAIDDVTGYPKLIAALRKHGYDEDALQKLAYQNWVRVLRETWEG